MYIYWLLKNAVDQANPIYKQIYTVLSHVEKKTT